MNRSVGIDIGTFSIKIAVVNHRNKSYYFDDFHEHPLKEPLTEDNQVEVIDYLRQISEKYNDGNTLFVMGLPQKHISSRICSFPFKERHKIMKTIAFELEDDIPFNFETANFGVKVTRYFKSMSEVIAFAAPKNTLEFYIQMAKDGNIPLQYLSVEGLAFANLFEHWQRSPYEDKDGYNPYEEFEEDEEEDKKKSKKNSDEDEVTKSEIVPVDTADIILHIGHRQTLALFSSDKHLIDSRSIDWGGFNLCEAIGKKYKISAFEARKELLTKSYVLIDDNQGNKDEASYSKTLKKSIDVLAKEIQLMVLSSETKFKIRFKNIYIIGGSSRIKNFGAYLTQKLERPVNRLKEFRMNPYVELDAGAKHAVTAGPAIGLAIEAFKKPVNPATNLMTGEFARKSEKWQKFWTKWQTTVKYVAALFVIILIYGIVRSNFASSMSEQATKLLKVQAKKVASISGSQTNSKVNKFVRNQKALIKATKKAKEVKSIGSALDLLNSISSKVPGKKQVSLKVKRLSITNGKMSIEGEIKTRKELTQLENSLKGLSTTGKVKETKGKTTTSPGKVPFSFELPINIESGDS